MFEKVCEFNRQVLNVEQRTPGSLTNDEFVISVKSLQEELDEFIEAYVEDHESEIEHLAHATDAMIDLMYFAIGVMYKQGLTPDDMREAFNVVHQANMTKSIGVNKKRESGGAADAVKGDDFKDPVHKIADIIRKREYAE
ncbi:MAG: hypothetical protein LC687_04590 [Actinobacteria bacterium]|nr:hypothetical protein [Actinomycetota bacterium]MCA1807111.1 hypothetical protein [Actinomycetota bacterium]